MILTVLSKQNLVMKNNYCKTNTSFYESKSHYERARRNSDARDYCLKQNSRVSGPWEFGEFIPAG